MKNTFITFLVLMAFSALNAQKANVKKGEVQKNKNITGIEGTFTIGGKPFLMVAESHRMIVDFSAVFYPIEDDMNLGEVIRQDNINIIDGFMTLEKCLYIERIIVNNGKTFLFYTKRNGMKGKVYFVELEEDCLIHQENATEVMQLTLGALSKTTDFAVRQSPDGSKILLAGMNNKTHKSSDFFFKVYSAGMKNLIWEKNISAPQADHNRFKGSDQFNTNADQNGLNKNVFLVNNDGRVYFLANETNPSQTIEDFSLISIDGKGDKQTQEDIKEPGNLIGQTFFRLGKQGQAVFIFFYSDHEGKFGIQIGDRSDISINALRVLEFDGNKLETRADYPISNEEKALFYPPKYRKPKSEYLIGGFQFVTVLDSPTGELLMVMETSYSNVGREQLLSNTANGYICVIVLDSDYKFKTAHSFARVSNTTEYGGGVLISSAFVSNGNLHLLFANELGQLQYVLFNNLQANKAVNLGAKYPDGEGFPLPVKSMAYQGGFIIPVINKKEICTSLLSF